MSNNTRTKWSKLCDICASNNTQQINECVYKPLNKDEVFCFLVSDITFDTFKFIIDKFDVKPSDRFRAVQQAYSSSKECNEINDLFERKCKYLLDKYQFDKKQVTTLLSCASVDTTKQLLEEGRVSLDDVTFESLVQIGHPDKMEAYISHYVPSSETFKSLLIKYHQIRDTTLEYGLRHESIDLSVLDQSTIKEMLKRPLYRSILEQRIPSLLTKSKVVK